MVSHIFSKGIHLNIAYIFRSTECLLNVYNFD